MKEPLYKIIFNDLKQAILSGTYGVDEQIPTELELSDQYHVSRITSKRAVTELENEGLIYRLRGKGTFVKSQLEQIIPLNKKNDLLFIMPFPEKSGFGNYAQGVFQGLEGTDYRLVMQVHDYITEETLPSIIADYAGIIFYPLDQTSHLELLYTLYLNKIPTVILDKTAESINFSTVVADNQQGGYLATTYLVARGLEKIAFISGSPVMEISTIRERYLGYLKALHEENKQLPVIFQPKKGEHLDDLLGVMIDEAINHGVDGFVAENDVIAIALINQLKERGIRIPEEVSVIGFDNIQASELIEPKLTTIKQNFAEIGLVACRKLIAEIENPDEKTEVITIDVEFIKRETTS